MPDRLKIIQGLFVLKGLTWVVLGGVYFLTQDTRMEPPVLLIVGGLLLLDALLYLFFGWAIGRKNPWIFVLALLFIAGNAVLTVTDDFGLIDLLVLVVDVVIVVLMFTIRREFFPAQQTESGG